MATCCRSCSSNYKYFSMSASFSAIRRKFVGEKIKEKALTKHKLKESRFKAEEDNRTERGSYK